MSEHKIEIAWERKTNDFLYDTYDRTHEVRFGGGQKILNSSAVEFLGKSEHANPEELLAASASTCHMLTFLAICARKKITVNSYSDKATAILDKNPEGKLAVTKIILRPDIEFEGPSPDATTLDSLHHKSHENCFIANSIKCSVEVQPVSL